MSIDEVPVAHRIESRLRELLSKARTLKTTCSVEPSLSYRNYEQDVATFSDLNLQSRSQTHRHHAAFETAARDILFEALNETQIQEPDFVDAWNLLDILQICAERDYCDSTLALWLIEELLDSQTITGANRVFDYLESRRERLIKNNFNRGKQNTILRSCNELLRRLSRAEDAVFCGRVFIFLFQSFPLGDKSAVNLRGEFHVDNKTSFDDPKGIRAAAQEVPDAMKIDSEPKSEPNDNDATNPPMEDESQAPQIKVEEPPQEEQDFYSKFWPLQNYFSNPPKLFDAEQLGQFKSSLEATVDQFKAVPKVPRVAPDAQKTGSKRKRTEENDEFADTFNPKYLTSCDLFDLELSDLTFQRHVLVQGLITLDFLLSLTPEAKQRVADLKAQRAMVYNYILEDQDATWASSLKSKIASYLKLGTDGQHYLRMVDSVLSRDKNWVRWKIESCPSIEKPPISPQDYLGARKETKRMCTNRRLKATPTGAMDMSFLSDANMNNLDQFKDPERFTPPSAESILGEIKMVDLDLEMADPDKDPKEWAELKTKRANKTWLALRLGARKKFAVFDKIDENKSLEELSDEPTLSEQPVENGTTTDGEAAEEEEQVDNNEAKEEPQESSAPAENGEMAATEGESVAVSG